MKKPTRTYRFIRWIVNAVYPKYAVIGSENLPPEPCIIVGNHSQIHGPLVAELRFIGKHYVWCASQMMNRKEIPAYAFQDFWSMKPKWTHPFFKLLSHLIVLPASCIFNNANTIAVYRDIRIMSTFKETMQVLNDGANVIIYPEHRVPHNHIIYDFQENFIDVAKLYCRKTGKALHFVPMYIAPRLHKLCLGQPTVFDPDAPIEEERKRICTYCKDSITALAESLPEHTVVPYDNLPKKCYPKNRP